VVHVLVATALAGLVQVRLCSSCSKRVWLLVTTHPHLPHSSAVSLLLPLQSVVGGQPLLIIGVAEPIVIIYGFMYDFASSTPGLGVDLFLPWAGWVCIFTALLCCLLAVGGASEGITYFTRFSGELFGGLIAILFLQVGIKVSAGLRRAGSVCAARLRHTVAAIAACGGIHAHTLQDVCPVHRHV
jgi:hypothetical protein